MQDKPLFSIPQVTDDKTETATANTPPKEAVTRIEAKSFTGMERPLSWPGEFDPLRYEIRRRY